MIKYEPSNPRSFNPAYFDEKDEHEKTKRELARVTRELDQIKDNIVRLADRYKPIEPDGGWKGEEDRIRRSERQT